MVRSDEESGGSIGCSNNNRTSSNERVAEEFQSCQGRNSRELR
jgi:hypothetical protein